VVAWFIPYPNPHPLCVRGTFAFSAVTFSKK
jgi:hypothetical protein